MAARRRARRPARRRPCEIKVANLLNSLAHIEAWIRAVREALSCLNPEMCIPCPEHALDVDSNYYVTGGGGMRVDGGCPPPTGGGLRVDGGCPPPTGGGGMRVDAGCPPPRSESSSGTDYLRSDDRPRTRRGPR